MFIYKVLETGRVPDALIRFGIRRLLAKKIREEKGLSPVDRQKMISDLKEFLDKSPIAVNTADANRQHYEVPSGFFELVLGRRMKYSCGYWEAGDDLDRSEERMMRLCSERALLKDGQSVLDLGCGWGSFSLYIAEHFPNSRVTAVSNSKTQKEYIENKALKSGLRNVRVVTADVNDLLIDEKFDRVVSIEMFEHMRNYRKLLKKISVVLKPGGRLFVHIFSHSEFVYLFDEHNHEDWIAKYFFTGGTMPSDALLTEYQEDLKLDSHWRVPGGHYQKTSNAWLSRMDANKEKIQKIFSVTYGSEAGKWFIYWRVFFMACAELFGFQKGAQWIVSHYLFQKEAL